MVNCFRWVTSNPDLTTRAPDLLTGLRKCLGLGTRHTHARHGHRPLFAGPGRLARSSWQHRIKDHSKLIRAPSEWTRAMTRLINKRRPETLQARGQPGSTLAAWATARGLIVSSFRGSNVFVTLADFRRSFSSCGISLCDTNKADFIDVFVCRTDFGARSVPLVISILLRLFESLADPNERVLGDDGLRAALAGSGPREQKDWLNFNRQQDATEAITRIFDKVRDEIKTLADPALKTTVRPMWHVAVPLLCSEVLVVCCSGCNRLTISSSCKPARHSHFRH
jgi:hypothetical protein